jgi:hypothetical protein
MTPSSNAQTFAGVYSEREQARKREGTGVTREHVHC